MQVLDIGGGGVVLHRELRGIAVIARLAQNIVGAPQPSVDVAEAFDVMRVAVLPADDGVRQTAQNVAIFISLEHGDLAGLFNDAAVAGARRSRGPARPVRLIQFKDDVSRGSPLPRAATD
jgi:hypothetical protein